ncbi:MAG: DUF1295 domain-containing protein [Melioribacteraceae bacterium]|nr:DUF1295 domain-containing protein [Melioribacteraceae bacterium]
MNKAILQNIGLILLTAVFSVGLMFASIELPVLIDNFLQSSFSMPSSDPAYDSLRIELFYKAYEIRLMGYICIGLILLLVILGFTTKKTGLVFAGSIALFLPVFATFAHSMFYLTGLGLLNVIMFPLLDVSFTLVDLGKVVLVPYWLLMWIFKHFGWYAHNFICYSFILIGSFIFMLGVFTWLKDRYKNKKVATTWIYKYSRHPQYLGWLIWSYGIMLYGPTLNNMKKSWGWNGTLPWLLSALVIIGICLLEEIKMKEKEGESYEEYRRQTPFLFPMPHFIHTIIKWPFKIIIRKEKPESRKEAGIAVIIYTLIFLSLSLFWVDFTPQQNNIVLEIRPYNQERVNSLVKRIKTPQSHRYRTLAPFTELVSMGSPSYPTLYMLMNDDNPDVREFAVRAASTYNIHEAIPELIKRLGDSSGGIAEGAVRGLGELQAKEAEDTLFNCLIKGSIRVRQDVILSSLSKIGCKKIMPYLEKRLVEGKWYNISVALRSMINIDLNKAKEHIYNSLNDERQLVKREAVNILLDLLPEDAIPHLEPLLDDENWEVRFYAEQAIDLIKEKYRLQ